MQARWLPLHQGHIGVEKKKTMRHDEDDEQDDEYACKGHFSPSSSRITFLSVGSPHVNFP